MRCLNSTTTTTTSTAWTRALLWLCVVPCVVVASILDTPPSPHVGESSDFAAQFYQLHRLGKVVDKLDYAPSELPVEVQKRITVGTFADLPGLLQRALLWDSGFVREGNTRRLIRIFPTCGQDMKTIAVNKAKYLRQTCTTNPDCAQSDRNGFCNQTQISPITSCAAEGVTKPSDSAMWALGGVLDDHLPDPNIRNHNWTELGLHNQMYAIHSVTEEVPYDKCPSPRETGVIIPCVVYDRSASNSFCNITENEYSELVTAWLQEPAGRLLPRPKKKPAFDAIWLIPIFGGVLVVVSGIVFFVWRRRRRDRHQKESPYVACISDVGFFDAPRSDGYTDTTSTRVVGSMPRDDEIRHSHATLERMLQTDLVVSASRIDLEDLDFETTLSRGAYGEVWRCNWHGTTVAVKRLLPHKTEDLAEISRFVNEILLTSTLDHPNIIRYIGAAWTCMSDVCMAMEFLPHGDLLMYLDENWETLTWVNDRLPMALGVARAMQYMHSLDPPVVHRDIKAKNVLLTETFDVKLIDFGISRDRVEETMTSGVGTPFWSAPEVLDGRRYSEQSDIYSFGVLLSEIANGETPYRNLRSMKTGQPFTSVHAVLNLVVSGRLRPSFPVDCPQRIQQVAMRCLHQDPGQRPTAGEVVGMLTDLQ